MSLGKSRRFVYWQTCILVFRDIARYVDVILHETMKAQSYFAADYSTTTNAKRLAM
jgi:hypothetical protein